MAGATNITDVVTDIAVIGAGPVGLFTVFEAGMLDMRCHVIDALDDAGGQCAALYPEKPIYDVPGLPVISAQELIERLRAQAAPFAPAYHWGQTVEALARGEDGRFRLETSTGDTIDAAAVVIAAGGGAFGPNRPPLEGIEGYEGTSVFYMVTRREAFRGKRVVIAGGGDTAVDWALSLAEIAARVTVVHRRAKFRAAPAAVAELRRLASSGAIELAVPYQLAGLEGVGGRLTTVILADLDGATRHVAADILLPFYGLAMSLGPIAGWGLNLDHNHITVDPATCRTSAPGIFAVGDIAAYPGKLKLILTGFAEAAMAAHAAYPLVHPDKALHFEYSTTKGLPGVDEPAR
jgi:thioredoxin reductase (NADPH)